MNLNVIQNVGIPFIEPVTKNEDSGNLRHSEIPSSLFVPNGITTEESKKNN